eukprot:426078-Prymnesium_polylepis.2
MGTSEQVQRTMERTWASESAVTSDRIVEDILRFPAAVHPRTPTHYPPRHPLHVFMYVNSWMGCQSSSVPAPSHAWPNCRAQ